MSHLHDNFWDDCKEDDPKFFEFNPKTKSYTVIEKNPRSKQKRSSKANLAIEHSNKLYNDALSRNRRFYNNNNRYASKENRDKELSECTFHPKILDIKSTELKTKIENYSKWPIYERGKIFQMKKRENNLRNNIELRSNYNNVYNYKPTINKNRSLDKIFSKKDDNDTINREYYDRMNNARTERVSAERSQLTNRENFYQNLDDSDGYYKLLTQRIKKKNRAISQKKVNDCMRSLHSTLMSINLDNDDE